MIYLLLGGVLIVALVLLYFTAKKNGKLEQQNKYKDLQINAKAQDFDFLIKDINILQNQMFQWQHRQDAIDARLKGVDVRILPDSELSELFKDPTSILKNTDYDPTQVGESIGPERSKESKK